MLRRISDKIILSYTALIVLLVAFLLVFLNDLIHDAHLTIIRREMDEKLKFIELVFREEPFIVTDPARLERETREMARIIDLRVTIINFNGRVISDSEVKDLAELDNHRYRGEITGAMRRGWGDTIRYSNTLHANLLYRAKRMDWFVVRLSKSLEEIDASIARLRRQIVLYGFVVVMVSLAIIILLSKRITRPINKTLEFAQQFSGGDYSKRILNYSEDEIGAVQKALNRMADTIVDKIDSLIFEQNKLKSTLESISDGIAVVGRDRRILIANKSFIDFFNLLTCAEGRMYYEVIRSTVLNSRIEAALDSGEGSAFEGELLSGIYCAVQINPISDEKAIQGMLVVLRDITEKKKIEQMKTDLVANMSHELKTPVTIMKGYLETIDETLGDVDACKGYIHKAIENADRQNAIINDILKLNMIENSHEFAVQDINIREAVENCLEILRPKAKARQIEYEISLEQADFLLTGNAFLAEEVFFNIIDNAINYNKSPGLIKITAEKDGRNTVIMIRDSGIGISPEHRDRIFERFYRVDKSRSRSTGGTGLGLSIVKHACEILSWKIAVDSDSGGTVFRITM